MKEFLETVPAEVLHGYTSGPGDIGVRTEIANYINNKFQVEASANLIYMTCGAAASLTVSLNAIVNSGDEVIVLAPFFPEYRVFAEQAGATLKVVPCKTEDLQIDFVALEKAITEKTKAKISKGNLGTKKPHAGVPRSIECREKIAKANSKAVLQFTKDGVFIQEYSSAKDASLLTGAGRTNISECCLGKRKTAKGFKWKYINDMEG